MKTAIYLFAGYAVAFIALWLIGGFIATNWDVRNWDAGGRYLVATLSFCGCIVAWPQKGTT
jgi:hypothetical protein